MDRERSLFTSASLSIGHVTRSPPGEFDSSETISVIGASPLTEHRSEATMELWNGFRIGGVYAPADPVHIANGVWASKTGFLGPTCQWLGVCVLGNLIMMARWKAA